MLRNALYKLCAFNEDNIRFFNEQLRIFVQDLYDFMDLLTMYGGLLFSFNLHFFSSFLFLALFLMQGENSGNFKMKHFIVSWN